MRNPGEILLIFDPNANVSGEPPTALEGLTMARVVESQVTTLYRDNYPCEFIDFDIDINSKSFPRKLFGKV